MNEIETGTVTGTGAVINISIGFVPDYFKIINITDGDRIDEWFRGMTDDTSIETLLAVALNAADGISEYAGSDSAAPGVSIGTDISESAKVLRWIAMRNGPGAQG